MRYSRRKPYLNFNPCQDAKLGVVVNQIEYRIIKTGF